MIINIIISRVNTIILQISYIFAGAAYDARMYKSARISAALSFSPLSATSRISEAKSRSSAVTRPRIFLVFRL